MKSALMLVFGMAFYASVRFVEGSGFGYELLISEMERLRLNQTTLQQQQEKAQQQISTLQAQLQSKNVNQERFIKQVSELAKANVKSIKKHKAQSKSDYDKLLREMEQLKLNHKNVQQQLEQLQNKNSSVTHDQQVSSSTQKPSKSLLELGTDHKWISWTAGNDIPANAVYAGPNWNEGKLYVGRITLNIGDNIVAKISPKEEWCYYAHGGKEHYTSKCELLTGTKFEWQWTGDGTLPKNAFLGGRKADNEPQYIGNVKHVKSNDNPLIYSFIPGTINRKDNTLTISFAEKEFKYSAYYVLVSV